MASHSNSDQVTSSSAVHWNPKLTTIDLVGGIHCHICSSVYANKKEFDTHYVTHETGSKDIIYTCVVCMKEIAGYPSFRGHCYTKHVIKASFKCDLCNKLFSKAASLKEHIKGMHRIQCSDCNKEFATKRELQLHQIIHNTSDMPPFKCQVCTQQIDTLNGCKEHVELHSSSIYFCPICNENIPTIDTAAEHLTKHFEDTDNNSQEITFKSEKVEPFIEQLGGIMCKCLAKFSNRVEFDVHFSSEHGNEDIAYICKICTKQFDKYSSFSNHAYNHFVEDRFCCDICFKTFDRLSRLVSHMSVCQANSDNNGKPFSCFICKRRYVTEFRWKEHLKNMHDVHFIMCPEESCEKVFPTQRALVQHQQTHHPKQKNCRQCGLIFLSINSCERHLDVHKKKLYICPVCNRNYGDKNLVLKHIPQHFQSVLHICKVCGKVYNAKNRLIEHIKSHEETKTHNCTYCNKSFTKIGHLQGHLNTHTGSRPYKCPICEKTFAAYPNWHKHLRRMHYTLSKQYNNKIEIQNTVKENETVKKSNETNAQLQIDISELSDVKLDSYIFEPDDSTMESDSIDQIVIEKELEMFESTNRDDGKNVFELVNLPTGTSTELYGDTPQQNPQPTNYPAEYGPEFNTSIHTDGTAFLDLDDHMLPHIDPLLTIKNEYNQNCPPRIDPTTYSQQKWEPIITKVYPEYSFGYGDMVESNRLSIMNTDIF